MVTDGRALEMDIVIVHYHAAASVRDAVAALRRDASRSNVLVNIVVADNGSTPEERALLQSLDIDYLNTGRNAGYAGAANIAFPTTRSDSIVLMNEDVIVLPGCLRALHTALMSGASVAGPQFYWDRDCIFLQPCTEERTRRNELLKVAGKRSLTKLERARKEWREHARRHWRSRDPVPTTALSGALLAFRRETWRAIGPFDDEFRLYFEENDWLFRVARAGLWSLYVPAAKAIHLHNPTLAQAPERLQWEAESFLRFGNRYYGERFMRRLFLACRRESVIPDWQAFAADGTDAIRVDISGECVWPLWVELTPSPFGFPAATTCITDPKSGWWPLPPMRGLEFLDGTFYLQVVDDIGRELCRYRFQRNAAPTSGLQPANTTCISSWPKVVFETDA
jgi:GT2 family glycosyltransferase